MTRKFNDPGIKIGPERKLVGMRKAMSMADFEVADLWKGFMPRRGEVSNAVEGELLSVTLYHPLHFTEYDANRTFEKWAGREVSDFKEIPSGMETLLIPAGLYAVFLYKGPGSDRSVFQYIFHTWMPTSGYLIDHRPHFEVLGQNYRNNGADSEEEIWIPVLRKGI